MFSECFHFALSKDYGLSVFLAPGFVVFSVPRRSGSTNTGSTGHVTDMATTRPSSIQPKTHNVEVKHVGFAADLRYRSSRCPSF